MSLRELVSNRLYAVGTVMGWTPEDEALENRALREHSLEVWFMCDLVMILREGPSVMLSSILKC